MDVCREYFDSFLNILLENKVEKVGDNWEHATCTWAHNRILNDFYIIYILSIYI